MLLPLALGLHLIAPKHPNVVFFLVDDLGWQDTSLNFGVPAKMVGQHFRTPNVEKLAKRGVQVNQAYSACPVCTPSRVALLTGQNPARNHITSWVHSGQDTEEPYPGLISPQWATKGFQPGQGVTLPTLFHNEGYRTVQIGKAHFGAEKTLGANPTHLGFDRTIAGSAAGNPNSYYGLDNFAAKKKNPTDPPVHNDVPDLDAYHGKDIFLEEALAQEGAKEIAATAKSGKPLFLWFSTYAVHTPLMPNKRLVGHYKGLDPKELAYATMVETYDNALGTLVDALKAAGQLDNTIIIFTSDNGGLSVVARGGYPNLHNLPLRSGKGSAYEGGTRVPLVFAGVGIPQGKVLEKTWITGTDMFATIANLAGVKAVAPDGHSFAEVIEGAKDAPRNEPNIWHFPHNRGGGGPGLEPFSAIRMGDFKAIFFYGPRRWELYNLKRDIGETADLATENPTKLKELAGRLLADLERMGAQFPVDERSGQVVKPRLSGLSR